MASGELPPHHYATPPFRQIKWYSFYHLICRNGEVVMNDKRQPVILSSDQASGRDSQGSSLVPMLVAGLVLIAIGAVVVMMFV